MNDYAVNYNIKEAIDKFVEQADSSKDNGTPNDEELKRIIDSTRENLPDAGQIATLRWAIKYIDDIDNFNVRRFSLNNIRIYCQEQLDLKQQQAINVADQDLSGNIERFKQEQKEKYRKYDTDYWQTAINLDRKDTYGQKDVWNKMEEGRQKLGLNPEYENFDSFRKQLSREKEKL